MGAEVMLAGRGAASVASTVTAAEGLASINGRAPDIAVLDVNLRSGTSFPVVKKRYDQFALPSALSPLVTARTAMTI